MTEMLPLKRIARLKYGEALAADQRIDGHYPVMGSGGISGMHDKPNFRAPGIVIGRKGSYGSIHWAPEGGFAIDTTYYIDSSCSSVHLRWLYYALQAVDLRGISQDVGVPGLSRESAHEVLLPAPLPPEQHRIAEFLDAETTRIDALLLSYRRRKAALAERTKGVVKQLLDESTSAEPVRLKFLLTARPRYGVLVPQFVDRGVKFIRVNDLTDLAGRADGLLQIPEALSAQYRTTVVKDGDVLVSVVGTLGRVAIAGPSVVGANVNRAIAVMRPRPAIERTLMAAWIASADFERQALLATGNDSAQRTLGMEDMANFALRWPSKEDEQRAIAREVESEQRKSDRLIERLLRQEALLVERRQALIAAAITGQIDVSTASGRGIED